MFDALHLISKKLLPSWMYQRLIGNWDKTGLQKYFFNTGWLFSARIISFIVSFLTISFVARYLGPDNYGKLSYVQSYVSLFSILATLGIDQILYRDLIEKPEDERVIIGTAVATKFVFGTGALIIATLVALFLNEEALLTWMVLLVSLTFIFQPFGVVAHYFNAQVKSKYAAYGSILLTFLIPLLKLICILMGLGILYFAALLAFEALALSLFNMYVYTRYFHKSVLQWRFSFDTFLKLMYEAAPLIFAGISGYLYARIDQVMIQHMVNSESVGFYDIAVKFSDMLGMIPGIIIGSLFPAIVNARSTSMDEYKKRLHAITLLCLVITFIFSLILYISSSFFIPLLFGQEFIGSVAILKIYVWSNMGTVSFMLIQNYLIAEKRVSQILYLSIIGATINILLNVVLIPKLGAVGAAYATLSTLFCIITVFLLTNFFQNQRSTLK